MQRELDEYEVVLRAPVVPAFRVIPRWWVRSRNVRTSRQTAAQALECSPGLPCRMRGAGVTATSCQCCIRRKWRPIAGTFDRSAGSVGSDNVGKGDRNRRKRQRKCIFCGRPAESREHFLASWMRHSTVLDRSAVNHTQMQTAFVPIADGTGEEALVYSPRTQLHGGAITSSKLKVVCKDHCNGGGCRASKRKPSRSCCR